MGYTDEEEFELKNIRYSGSDGNTYVTYFDDGEEITITQHLSRLSKEEREW